MKGYLTVPLLLLLSAQGVAQTETRHVLSDLEVDTRYEKLMIVTTGDTESIQAEHLRSHGISESGARALGHFRIKAQLEMGDVFRGLYEEICARQQELRESGGAEMLAQIIERQKLRESEARRRLLSQASELLSPVDQERLEHLYTTDHGPTVILQGTRAAAYARDGKLPVEQAITLSCQYVGHNQEGARSNENN